MKPYFVVIWHRIDGQHIKTVEITALNRAHAGIQVRALEPEYDSYRYSFTAVESKDDIDGMLYSLLHSRK